MKAEDNHRVPDIADVLQGTSAEEIESLQKTWDAVASYPEDTVYRALWQESVWNSIEERLSDEAILRVDPVNSASVVFLRWVAAAVVVAGLVGVAFLVRPVSYVSPPGETLAVTLPDGSHVLMNSGSAITHPRWFLTARNVELTGEALFDVVADDEPFVIETDNARVRVVGTTFNVRAREETAVTVVSGIVEVSPLTAETSVTLAPGEHAVANGAVVTKSVGLNNDDFLAWRNGDFVFTDASLASIVDELERRFAVHVQLVGQDLAERRVTTNLRQPLTTESVIRDLCEALQVRYRRTSDGYEIFAEVSG